MVKNFYQRVAVIFAVMLFVAMTSPVVMFAGSLDDLSSSGNTGSQTSDSGGGGNNDSAISDYLRGYTPVTNENMGNAATIASPIVSALGTLAGVLIMFGSAAIFVVTAADLLYIGLPFTRSILNPQYAAGGAAGGSPMGGMGGMGGMGMGMGMRGGMMGGGMMGGGGGAAGAMPEHGLRRKWVSDEAVYCVNTYANGGVAPQGGGGMSPMGGMGGMGGMGMMGGGMMGGMGGGAQAQAQEMPTKSVIFEYLKKRTFFIIIFAVCTVLLMSSVLTDCGINIAQLAIKIFTKVNAAIAGVNV